MSKARLEAHLLRLEIHSILFRLNLQKKGPSLDQKEPLHQKETGCVVLLIFSFIFVFFCLVRKSTFKQ